LNQFESADSGAIVHSSHLSCGEEHSMLSVMYLNVAALYRRRMTFALSNGHPISRHEYIHPIEPNQHHNESLVATVIRLILTDEETELAALSSTQHATMPDGLLSNHSTLRHPLPGKLACEGYLYKRSKASHLMWQVRLSSFIVLFYCLLTVLCFFTAPLLQVGDTRVLRPRASLHIQAVLVL
jgi:hypothetical protein